MWYRGKYGQQGKVAVVTSMIQVFYESEYKLDKSTNADLYGSLLHPLLVFPITLY